MFFLYTITNIPIISTFQCRPIISALQHRGEERNEGENQEGDNQEGENQEGEEGETEGGDVGEEGDERDREGLNEEDSSSSYVCMLLYT